MSFAYPMQKIQDWLTQQWVIIWGRRINPKECSWLMGPFGNPGVIGANFVDEFAAKEKLTITDEAGRGGLISSMTSLNLPEPERMKLSAEVVEFYENTAHYDLQFSVKWNPLFKVFGVLIGRMFSNRLRQLNIPTVNSGDFLPLKSKIVSLAEAGSNEVKYTFWLRSLKTTGEPVYSGVYGVSTLPGGKTCIKAVFPLPNGNATVLMVPGVGQQGELILDSCGNKFGDAGFYFLLKDGGGAYWAQYIRAFRDRLVVKSTGGSLLAEQVLTLWRKEVLRINYRIEKKPKPASLSANHL